MAESKRPDAQQPDAEKSGPPDRKVDTFGIPVDLSNTMLGEFRLLRKLGEGGMAEVYLAEQTSLRRQVAVKILRFEFVTDETYVKRFLHEAAAAGSLNHPNIVQVYMVGEQNGLNYIAQEYVHGRTLKDYLKRKGPLDIKIMLHILRQVASALQAASENGIVHRDIKPENILLTNKGEAKVADFGLAQLTLQGERVSLTQAGLTMGTPLYMSPEQVNGLPLDSRSDIYSFGIMAWNMLAGRPPFVGETAMAIAMKHLNEKPPQLTDFRPDVPASIRDFVKRLIQKKKEDRPADFGAVLVEIKQLIRQVVGKEESTLPLTMPARRKPIYDRPVRQQLGWLIAACVIVFGSSAGLGWAMRTQDLSTVVSGGAPRVTTMPTAAMQLIFAENSPQDEARWITVLEFKGASDEFKLRAKSALATIYMKTNRRQQAETYFKELELDSKSKPDGLAGQALLAHLKGDDVEAKRLMSRVDDLKAKLYPELEQAFLDLHQRLDSKK